MFTFCDSGLCFIFQILRQLREETASLHGSQMQVFIISSFLCMFYLYIVRM